MLVDLLNVREPELVGLGAFSRVYPWGEGNVIKMYNQGSPISCNLEMCGSIIYTAFWECLINTYLNKERLPAPRTEGLVTIPARFSDDIYLGLVMERAFEPICTPALERAHASSFRRIERRGIHVEESIVLTQLPGTTYGVPERFFHNVLQDATGKLLLIDYGPWEIEPTLVPALAKVYKTIAAPQHIQKPSFDEVIDGRVRD